MMTWSFTVLLSVFFQQLKNNKAGLALYIEIITAILTIQGKYQVNTE